MSEVRVVGLAGAEKVLAGPAVEALMRSLRGRALRPGEGGYDEARRLYNGMIDRHPALLVRCAGVGDVLKSVRFAREHGILVSVRAGGHNVAGYALCDGGLTIDLSAMRSVVVDPATRRARAEPGATWLDFDTETQAFGLATTGGLVASTGIAGLTLGGGIGWLMRKHGLTCDNLLGVDVVTGGGEFVTATEHEN
ncbi:MAG: FAD-dependent oxidoreductase, partial [Alphaproteobacteria bacterium]|nr:FAD-dependent oxidoreductase [Alphaproteobacteria bacterium]